MISNNYSLSHLCEHFLSHSCTLVEWVCVSNREAHSIFIFFRSLNFWISYVGSSNPNSVMYVRVTITRVLMTRLTMEGTSSWLLVILPIGASGTTKNIFRIFFEVTIIQHSPLTRRVFYNNKNNSRRRRESILNIIRVINL